MARLPFPENTITGRFGTMSAYRKKHGLQPHSGVDFAPKGSNRKPPVIPAVGNGTIRLTQYSRILGWCIVQTIWDTKLRRAKYVGYAHLSCNKCGTNCKGGHDASQAFDLKVGDKVKEGQPIATMGTSGSASSANHLHLTLSNTVKGIFGVTAAKQDYVKWLATQQTAPKQADTQTEAVVEQEPVQKVIYACPHCKKELK